ncbi:MAG TPA: OmpA family protein [Flavobacterium sp.]|jgi:OOP family OmpA-OmpF porin
MKKLLIATVLVATTLGANAQTEVTTTGTATSDSDYNKWSVELNGGVNKLIRPLTAGYFNGDISSYNADFGIRYMFNNKFGLKADIGYLNFENHDDSQKFQTRYYRTSLQGVANLGNIMDFKSWTNTFGLLAHTGVGYAQFQTVNKNFTDRMGNFIIGMTGQIKLSNRIALTGDVTAISNSRQNLTFDGNTRVNRRVVQGGLLTGTVGLTLYLGKNEKHADWVSSESDRDDLSKRVDDIETMLRDTDQDGVADYLDQEPNTTNGVAVDTKGRAIDKNQNGVPDELESYLERTYGGKNTTTVAASDSELIRNLINQGYVTTYFDFNKSTPTNVSTEGIDFILTYLRNNPTASVDIIGHADELGRTPYNDKLSAARANAVRNVLLNAKIDPSRLNIVPAGEDASVNKESEEARRLVRRVTFRIK